MRLYVSSTPRSIGISHRAPCDASSSRMLVFRSRIREERAVPYLDAVPVPGRETAQEADQGAEVGGAERRGQLNPQRVRPRPEGLDRGQERVERLVGLGEPALMGDRPGQLEDEPEAGRGLRGPRPHRVQGGRRVERRIALHGIAPRRVRAQAFPRGQRNRQVAALPGCVRPHRAADVEFHDPERTRA